VNDAIETSKIVKRRPRRAFNLEDKKRFYTQWKTSGIKKNDFCIKNDLSPSVFDKWCRKFAVDKNPTPSKNDWTPLVPKNSITIPKDVPLKLEIKLPYSIKICLFSLVIILFLKELLHAITVIW
jgi:transposase-like protein